MAIADVSTELRRRLQAVLAGRYTIERELGQGGMATVFLAQDVRLGRAVAIKLLDPALTSTIGVERFLREIAITARLNHPHILSLIESGQEGGLVYYVMPHIEGESLRDRLRREPPVSVEGAAWIAREVADALTYAHARGVIHRDIKPENILLSDGHAWVADFGIARAIETCADSVGKALTVTGLPIGTPAYMSPEQVEGRPDVDGRRDDAAARGDAAAVARRAPAGPVSSAHGGGRAGHRQEPGRPVPDRKGLRRGAPGHRRECGRGAGHSAGRACRRGGEPNQASRPGDRGPRQPLGDLAAGLRRRGGGGPGGIHALSVEARPPLPRPDPRDPGRPCLARGRLPVVHRGDAARQVQLRQPVRVPERGHHRGDHRPARGHPRAQGHLPDIGRGARAERAYGPSDRGDPGR